MRNPQRNRRPIFRVHQQRKIPSAMERRGDTMAPARSSAFLVSGVIVVRTPCDNNQNADQNDFRQEREAPLHPSFYSEICNPKSEIFIESIRDWSRGVCYVLLSHRCGPVALRLEQGTHNSLQALGSLLHARNSIGSQRLQTTARHVENGNKWQRNRVGRSKGSRQAHAPEHDKEKAFF